MKQTHKNIEAFCKVIRFSFNDSLIVYRYGACYGFFLILKHLFPRATAYYENSDKNHVFTKIGTRFYDIDGETQDTGQVIKFTETDHRWASKWAYGQRIEWMLAKYHSEVLKRAKID